MFCRKRNADWPVLKALIEGRGITMGDFYQRSVVLRLVQVCPALVPQFFTNWAHQAQYATHAHVFLSSFFVTVENKRLVNPTPKRKVARWIAPRARPFLDSIQRGKRGTRMEYIGRLSYYNKTGKHTGVSKSSALIGYKERKLQNLIDQHRRRPRGFEHM